MEADPEGTERREDEELEGLGKDRVGRLNSSKLLVPTKDRKGVEEVDISKLTNEQRNIIVDQVLEVRALHNLCRYALSVINMHA